MSERTQANIKFLAASALALVAYLPALWWMWDRWMAKESYYSHGILIPIVSAYIIWQRRKDLEKVGIAPDMAAIPFIAVCLVVNMVSAALRIYFLSGFALIATLCGIALFVYGRKFVRSLVFPIVFLFGMIPLPLAIISNLTVKLKLFAADISTKVLNMIGFKCIRDGSFIRMPTSFIEVAAPCSGLRSIIALLTLGLIFAYFMKASYVKKLILFVASVPIAIAANVFRIVSVAVVNDLYGEKAAMGLFHDMMGYSVFVLAFLGLMGVMQLLEHKQQ